MPKKDLQKEAATGWPLSNRIFSSWCLCRLLKANTMSFPKRVALFPFLFSRCALATVSIMLSIVEGFVLEPKYSISWNRSVAYCR